MNCIHSLDYLKTIFAVLVVFAHTNWMQRHLSPPVFVLGNGLMRMLVPLFCVIAGYFLYRAIERGKTGRWLMRVLCLYLFWMAVYIPYWQGQMTSARAFAITMLWGFSHLWFLSGLLVAGLAVAGCKALGARLMPGHPLALMIAAAVLCALIGVGLEYLDLSGLRHVPTQRFRNGLFMCFPFVTLGYVLSLRAERGDAPPARRRLVLIAALGLGLLCLEAWLVQAWRGTGVMIEVPISTYLAVPAVFLLVLQLDLPPQPVDLGLISATIYFLHIWAFQLAEWVGLDRVWALMIWGVGVPTLVALVYDALIRRRARGRRGTEVRPHAAR